MAQILLAGGGGDTYGGTWPHNLFIFLSLFERAPTHLMVVIRGAFLSTFAALLEDEVLMTTAWPYVFVVAHPSRSLVRVRRGEISFALMLLRGRRGSVLAHAQLIGGHVNASAVRRRPCSASRVRAVSLLRLVRVEVDIALILWHSLHRLRRETHRIAACARPLVLVH